MLQDDMEQRSSKMSSLMDLIKKMKELHSGKLSSDPKEVAIEVHEEHALPMGSDSEESPEEESMESPEEESSEDQESHSDMEIPEGLKKLLLAKLSK